MWATLTILCLGRFSSTISEQINIGPEVAEENIFEDLQKVWRCPALSQMIPGCPNFVKDIVMSCCTPSIERRPSFLNIAKYLLASSVKVVGASLADLEKKPVALPKRRRTTSEVEMKKTEWSTHDNESMSDADEVVEVGQQSDSTSDVTPHDFQSNIVWRAESNNCWFAQTCFPRYAANMHTNNIFWLFSARIRSAVWVKFPNDDMEQHFLVEYVMMTRRYCQEDTILSTEFGLRSLQADRHYDSAKWLFYIFAPLNIIFAGIVGITWMKCPFCR